ncbi:rod-determining factor RdfA [Haloarcula sp. GH36]|uniref:rod-determining factor RdfA n=1 Tax=Haloarcula montana TaxID=3111776 RepID=UPI002D77704B|nr:rod-determining factor RdfA [Haloarcula sp. GH36]
MTAESEPTCKIDRVAAKWDLKGIDRRLRARRAAGDSLRDLETYFNESVVAAALDRAQAETVDGEAANLYRLLTGADVSAGKRVDAESKLRRNGIDPEPLADDFVSYQTVRTHFNDCLETPTERETTLTVDDARTTVLKLVSRTESVAHRTIDRLVRSGALTIPAPSVTVSLRVACSECNNEYSFTRLLDRGGCSCGGESGRD